MHLPGLFSSDASTQPVFHPTQIKLFIVVMALLELKETICLRLVNIIYCYNKLTLKVISLDLPALNKSAPHMHVILSLDIFIYKTLHLVFLANHGFILT